MRIFTKRFAAPVALALATTSLAACSDGAGAPETTDESNVDGTLADAVGDVDDLSTVASALDDTGLDSVFDGPGAYTLFAPNDAAFAALGEEGSGLTSDEQRPILVALLRNHVVPGHLTPEAIKQAIKDRGGDVDMRTLGDGTLTFADGAEGLVVSGGNGEQVQLAGTATATSNGVLIPIGGLLESLPEPQG